MGTVFYGFQCIYSHLYAANENEAVIFHSGESGHFLYLFSSSFSSVFAVVCRNLRVFVRNDTPEMDEQEGFYNIKAKDMIIIPH